MKRGRKSAAELAILRPPDPAPRVVSSAPPDPPAHLSESSAQWWRDVTDESEPPDPNDRTALAETWPHALTLEKLLENAGEPQPQPHRRALGR